MSTALILVFIISMIECPRYAITMGLLFGRFRGTNEYVRGFLLSRICLELGGLGLRMIISKFYVCSDYGLEWACLSLLLIYQAKSQYF